MNKFKQSILSLFLALTFFLPAAVLAQVSGPQPTTTGPTNTMTDRLQSVAGAGGFQTSGAASVPVIIGTVINVILGFLGAIFLALMIYAGYRWMMAAGNEKDVEEAKGTIKNAIIGLIVVLSSWSIWTFILKRFVGGA